LAATVSRLPAADVVAERLPLGRLALDLLERAAQASDVLIRVDPRAGIVEGVQGRSREREAKGALEMVVRSVVPARHLATHPPCCRTLPKSLHQPC
jgi:hypothetical protein